MATVSRGLDFFALEENALRALEVSVVGEKMDVYAVMSVVETLVSQYRSAELLRTSTCWPCD